MKNQFVNYESALALKELGFDEPCFGFYKLPPYYEYLQFKIKYCDKDSYAYILICPLHQQAIAWLLNALIPYTPNDFNIKIFTNGAGIIDQDDLKLFNDMDGCVKNLINLLKLHKQQNS